MKNEEKAKYRKDILNYWDRVIDEKWMNRIFSKYQAVSNPSGSIMPPWHFDDWFSSCDVHYVHRVHIRKEAPDRLFYFRSLQDGRDATWSDLRIGRYLTHFWGDVLSESDIRDKVEACAGILEPIVLKLAHTADAIVDIFNRGPRSCMSKKINEFQVPVHPVTVYAAGDLAVAYIKGKKPKSIGARCVVWPDKMMRSRIYGDEARMKVALKEAGYTKGREDLLGAKLLMIPIDDTYVMPYLDGVKEYNQCVKPHEDGKHFVICNHSEGGAKYAQSEYGWLTTLASRCACCEEPHRTTSMYRWAEVEEYPSVTTFEVAMCSTCVDQQCDRCSTCNVPTYNDFTWHRTRLENEEMPMCNGCIRGFPVQLLRVPQQGGAVHLGEPEGVVGLTIDNDF